MQMTTQRAYIARGMLLWLAACLVCSALLYAEQIRRQYWQYDRAFTALFSTISTALTQNESVIPILNGDEDLALLRQKFPQIQSLEKTTGRALDAPRVEPLSATSYWLYNPYRQIRVQVNLAPQLHPDAHFADIRLSLTENPTPGSYRWHWTRQFPQHFQPFILQASATPHWFRVALLPHVLLVAGWAFIISMTMLLLWGRKQQRSDRQRADYYQHARLNTLGEMAAGVVHEINQPLTATQMWIQGGIRQLDQGRIDEAQHAMRSALTQTQRINDLLTRFRAHLVQEEVTMTRVNLADSWQRVGNLLEREPGSKQIYITHDFSALYVQADRLWLEQVLHNLLNNAIQAQADSPQGWVHIASEAAGYRVKVTISDGGPGLSPEALKLALMPLFSERLGGLGLGLTLSESLMTRMNGSLELANAPGGGAQISLWLIREK
ncbi:sensor histidine kinase [Scandinavium lactucae]|uniref:histidine kinase n=1 Tax=Scandinavium lactucae TaxID=3095028 RepID=A0ABU4QI19_9ENTR|nr:MULTISPECIES: ATP-binding protein [unclassified Scandinavium]MDX6038893.1 ATP-binding protein [Scandinavium sp. V105_6]MDX6049151.1 ATP-binding protein [Scandinavium sp. V105_1]